MTVVAPPPQDELELLMKEARARQIRRRMAFAAAVAAVAALVLGIWAGLPGGRSAARGDGGPPPSSSGQTRQGAAARPHGPMYSVGTSGGVTWAVGLNGLWITRNGAAWRAVPLKSAHVSFSPDHVTQVAFTDPKHGWVVAAYLGWPRAPEREQHAELGRTSDGGRTWRWSRLDLCSSLCSGQANVSFLDASHGFLSIGWIGPSLSSALFETTDGGATWRKVHAVPGRGEIAFLDERQGFLVQPYVSTGLGPTTGSLFVTRDGGRTWRSRALGLPTGRIGPNAPAIFGSHLIAAAPDALWVSRDAGRHWTMRHWPTTEPLGFNGAFSAVSPTMWFAGELKRLWVTTDAGRSWQPVGVRDPKPTDANGNILGLDFTSPLDGWALWGTTIFHTHDGGMHWGRAEPAWVIVKHGPGGRVIRVRG